jgi:transposase
MFREVSMIHMKEVLRQWLRGAAKKKIAANLGLDRKTVRRYVFAATALGIGAGTSEDDLTDEILGEVAQAVSPGRRAEPSDIWKLCEDNRALIEQWLREGLRLTKIHRKLRESGVEIAYITLYRFARQELGFGPNRTTTIRVDDGKPGEEIAVDFGRMGPLWDPATERMRLCRAFIFTPNVSRYRFVWPCWRETTEEVIEACEAAWQFYGGIFRVMVPDSTRAIVARADPIQPQINEVFLEYAQARGFVIDPARVRHAKDKPRVENAVPYVREDCFAGEQLLGMEDARRGAERWSREIAGMKVHRTTQRRPAEHFELVEKACLLAPPTEPFDIPVWKSAKVHPDQHIEFSRALYSLPVDLRGRWVRVRGDSKLVHIYFDRKLVKTHPRQPPGRRSTDPNDFPIHKRAYAMRDVEYLKTLAISHGPSIGQMAERLLDVELPWTRMRRVYRLVGLVRRYGQERVEEAAHRAVAAGMFDVVRLARMLERPDQATQSARSPRVQLPLRFGRSPGEYAIEMSHKEERPCQRCTE